MCKEVEIERNGKFLRVCSRSGLPVTIKTPYGNFCEKECDIDAVLFAKQRAEYWAEDMGPIFKRD